MRLIRNLKNIKNNIKYAFQRTKKGYCDQDLFSIDAWFIELFPKMLGEFAEFTIGCPGNEEELIKEVKKFPKNWVEEQEDTINNYLNKYDSKFDIKCSCCCWILIILRMKHCFEMCDEWNERYEEYWDKKEYEKISNEIEKYKKEAFYLFEKWFYNLWW